MNCQKIREAIGTGASRAVVAAHLDGCAECDRHFREIHSLLALLREQPRVSAPSDFEFRVRAGIARAKAEQSAPTGLTSGFRKLRDDLFSGSLSWFQATAATAAVAAIVTVTAYNYGQTDQTDSSSGPAAGLVAAVQVGGGAAETAAVAGDATAVVSTGGSALEHSLPSSATVTRPSGAASRLSKQAAVTPTLAVSTIEPASSDSVVSAANSSMKVFNSEQGRMISTSAQMTLIGAEMASQANGRSPRSGGYVPSI